MLWSIHACMLWRACINKTKSKGDKDIDKFTIPNCIVYDKSHHKNEKTI